jgi:hypothetical protein
MIQLKESFKRSFPSLPKTFRIEDYDYLYSVGQVATAFIIFGLVILFFIILYLILRLGFKKCIGPVKASQVTKFYRNLTWFILSIIYLYSYVFPRISYSLHIYYLLFS